MKISVIIPVYNVSEYIERCLLSVLNQTWQDLEVILVNDFTPDNSIEIAKRVVASHVRGQIVTFLAHEKNQGLSAARNTGISEALGEYLYFLDSDDYLPLDSIACLAQVAIYSNSNFVIGNYEIVGADRWAPPLQLSTGVIEGNEKILSAYVHDKWYVMAWNKLVKRSFLLENNLFFQENIVHEDDLWSFKLACISTKMSIVNSVTYFYYMQPNSIMRTPSLYNLECRVKVIGLIFDFIKENNLCGNCDIYILFETLKAKYFDRILYFTKDKQFHFQSYCIFREKKYIYPIKALFTSFLGVMLAIRNVHYSLPEYAGYCYFKTLVNISYYFKVLQIKVRQVLHLK